MKLYNEIKEAMATVLEAENNSKLWKQEANNRMKDVRLLINTSLKISTFPQDAEGNEQIPSVNDIISQVREELTAPVNEADPDQEYIDEFNQVHPEANQPDTEEEQATFDPEA